MVDNSKSPEGEISSGSRNMVGGQGASQSGEALLNLIWDRTDPPNLILAK